MAKNKIGIDRSLPVAAEPTSGENLCHPEADAMCSAWPSTSICASWSTWPNLMVSHCCRSRPSPDDPSHRERLRSWR